MPIVREPSTGLKLALVESFKVHRSIPVIEVDVWSYKHSKEIKSSLKGSALFYSLLPEEYGAIFIPVPDVIS